MATETVDVRGLRIAFERRGEGPPLLLLHGGLSDHREWRAQLDGLSDAFTVVAWDTMRIIYDGLGALKGQKWDPDKFMAAVKGRSFDSPRGKVTISAQNGDIVQNVYIRRVEKRDGVLQNVELETFTDVAPH